MTAPDPWDDPVDPDAVPDWEPPTTEPDPEPIDDETAYWRDVRNADTQAYTPAYSAWLAEERRIALTVACSVCKMVVGQPCIRVSGNPPQPVNPPEPLRRYPAHEPRRRAAQRKLTAR
ncbi:zinc finger domain-containing protein [Mycolicibacterium psychrotolerans]|uniref:zinc finger domain-containing protein n=1 Tax=Mycolicibacterium psychrotolerans TaxID=216929 RepID=UPI003D6673DF